MVKEGIYRVIFGGVAYETQSIFVLREGRVAGVSFQGTEHEGTYEFDPHRNLVSFDMMATFPGEITLVTGYKIPKSGATVRVTGEAPLADPTSRFSLVVADKAVDVAMTYIRPLP